MATYNITSGVTSSYLVLNDDIVNVSKGGEVWSTTANSGGYVFVSSGGVARGTTVNSSGFFSIYSGGRVYNTTLKNSGWMMIWSDGSAGGTVVSSGGILGIGGIATSTTVYEGATAIVLNNGVANYTSVARLAELGVAKGGTVSNTTVNHGELYLSSGAVAQDTVVDWYGSMYVNQGAAMGTILKQQSELHVFGSGAQVDSTTVDYAFLYVTNSGLAYSTTVERGNVYVSDGGMIGSTTMSSGAMLVGDGGFAYWTTVYSSAAINVDGGTTDQTGVLGGILVATSGAWLDNTAVASSGAMTMLGGRANTLWVFSGGRVNVSSGAVVSGAVLASDGHMELFNGATASAVTVNLGGILYVYSGATATATTVNSNATLIVSSGAEVVSTTVSRGGQAIVADGKATSTVVRDGVFGTFGEFGILSSTTVLAGGTMGLLGGDARYTTVSSGGSFAVYIGRAFDTAVNSGGSMEVIAWGTKMGVASRTSVNSGAVLSVASGGFIADTYIYSGTVTLSSGGSAESTGIGNGAVLEVMEGGAANVTEITNGQADIYGGVMNENYVYNEGALNVYWGEANSTTVYSGGGVEVYLNGVARDVTVNDGGALRVHSGGATTGPLTIGTNATVFFDRGGVLDFDVSAVRLGSPALVNDLSLVQGAPDFTITVSDYQAEGIYSLAGGATGFAATVTVSTDAGTALGTLSVGGELVYGDYTYGLDLTDSLLALTVTQGYIPPTPPAKFKQDDLNADGRADIVMTIDQSGHAADGSTGAWLIQDNQTAAWGDLSQRNPGWEIFGMGATNAYKTTNDVYVRSSDNVIGAWVTDDSGAVVGWETVGEFDADTQILGLGDFDGNMQTDLLLRNTNGAVGCYFTGGPAMTPVEVTGWNYFQSLGDEWTIAAVGDLNGDGRSDVVLKHDAGFAGSWLTQADYTMAWANLDTLADGFTIVGCGDFNGDGVDDVLLQNGTYFGAWIVEEGSVSSWMGLGDFGSVTVEQIADFNGDGIDDLRIRTAAGDIGSQLVRGEDSTMWAYYGSVGPEWSTSLAAI